MKKILMTLPVFSLLLFQVSCNKADEEMRRNEQTIQREEEIRRSDIRDDGQMEDLPSDDELGVERSVLGEDELDLND